MLHEVKGIAIIQQVLKL